MIHDLLSHSDTEDWIKVNQFFVSKLAYLCFGMAAIQEGEGTLLDHTLLLVCSSMLMGNHDATQLPVVLMGGGGSSLKGGQVHDYRSATERQMCRLYLSILNRFDIHLGHFEDATTPLEAI